MIELKDLLFRFRKTLLFEENKKDLVVSIIYKTIGIQIESKNIKIKNNIIYINTKPIYKNEIFLNKNKILLKLRENLGEKTPKDII